MKKDKGKSEREEEQGKGTQWTCRGSGELLSVNALNDGIIQLTDAVHARGVPEKAVAKLSDRPGSPPSCSQVFLIQVRPAARPWPELVPIPNPLPRPIVA